MDEVLDMLAWFHGRLHEAYQRLMTLPYFQIRAGRNINRVLQVIRTMKVLFGQGRESPLGRFVLEGYSKVWQMLPNSQAPEFEGKEELSSFLNTLKRPFITKLKE